MRFILLIVFFFVTSLASSQRFSEFEKILNVENMPFSKSEIRVYKKHSSTTGLELFRIYYNDDKKDWKAEFYYTLARKLKDDSSEIVVRNFELKSFYNTEYLALKLLTSDIKYLPNDDAIRYKMKSKPEITLDIGGYFSYPKTYGISVVDGVRYYVQVIDQKEFNEIEYSNPERYLDEYPTIDELISFNEFLDIIKKNFNVFEDYKKFNP